MFEWPVPFQASTNWIKKRKGGRIGPPPRRDREGFRDVEGIERIKPRVLVGGAQRDRPDRHGIAGLPEKDSASADDVVRADGAEFSARPEARHAVIEAGSDHEMVVVPEQLIVVGSLQRKP